MIPQGIGNPVFAMRKGDFYFSREVVFEMSSLLVFLMLFSFSFCWDESDIDFPKPEVVVYKPKGFRISIPDDGYSLFAVHININKEIDNLAAGEINHDVGKKKNGRWTYEDKSRRLKPGDKLYFWLYVVKDKLGYHLFEQSHTVNERVDIGNVPKIPDRTDDEPGNCEISLTKVSGVNACKGRVLLDERFSSDVDFDSVKSWSYDVFFPDSSEGSPTLFAKEFSTYRVSNGLRIQPQLLEEFTNATFATNGCLKLKGCTSRNSENCEKCASSYMILPPVVSSRITTKNFFSFLYGKVEIRAKVPRGDWLVPEIWLEPKELFYGSSSGRIDIVNIKGNEKLICGGRQSGRNLLKMGLIFDINNNSVYYDKTGDWNAFHVYSMTWTPEGINFDVDGQAVGGLSATFPLRRNLESANLAPFDREFYISLGVHAGGRSDFPDDCINQDKPKPWQNDEAKQILNFWRKKDDWRPTWDSVNGALEISHIKVTAL